MVAEKKQIQKAVYDIIKLEGTEIGFWQGVFIASVRSGVSRTGGKISTQAEIVADLAIQMLRDRTELESKTSSPYRDGPVMDVDKTNELERKSK